ncbi:MAG: hypothetical protein SFT68_02500 [Rickettsiaceae bacterium]|nr:hypothetical protein [Rickettsiaceae bacterium]
MLNFIKLFICLYLSFTLSGCSRDLSASTYTSDDTLNMVFHGRVIASRQVKIKEHDRMSENSTGGLAGAALAGGAMGAPNAKAGPVIGAAIVGGAVGAVIEDALSTSKGIEYIVEVDTSKTKDDYYQGSSLMRNALAAIKASGMVTVVQSMNKDEPILNQGQKVLVIVSEKRSRVIPSNFN